MAINNCIRIILDSLTRCQPMTFFGQVRSNFGEGSTKGQRKVKWTVLCHGLRGSSKMTHLKGRKGWKWILSQIRLKNSKNGRSYGSKENLIAFLRPSTFFSIVAVQFYTNARLLMFLISECFNRNFAYK